ncbi:FAD-binding oxidoreductase [Roseobacteraceae bacterium S113]
MQRRVGKRDDMEPIGRSFVRPFMPDQHRAFFENLPSIVIGSVDERGWPWASMLAGRPGFMRAPTARRPEINAAPIPGDPLAQALKRGALVGTVGLELHTRRRNRLNARVLAYDGQKITLSATQSFGNCPQYIQTHELQFVRDPHLDIARPPAEEFTRLSPALTRMIAQAHTFFVASAAGPVLDEETHGPDVSHRGGQQGFVKVEGNTLLIPDFAGNAFFNTLGNFLTNPKAGLLFPDYATGDIVMMTGRVEVLEDGHRDIAHFVGAERGWRFSLDHGLLLKDALPFRAQFDAYSPNSLLTDTWHKANARSVADTKHNSWRPLKVTNIEDESKTVRSFTLEPVDGLPLVTFKAGQHLTLKLQGRDESSLIRTYTLSSAPGDAAYSISVKREQDGRASAYLHDSVVVGDILETQAPRGDFWLDGTETRPAILFAGGVGITPMISMARHVLNEGQRVGRTRALTIFHAAQNREQRAFFHALRNIAEHSNGKIRYISTLDLPDENAVAGRDYDHAGFIDRDLVKAALPLDDYDAYLCGPPAFMQAIYDTLVGLGIPDHRIFAESFGPASLTRTAPLAQAPVNAHEAETATLSFAASNVSAPWTAKDGVLLEAAEAAGLTPAFSCRSGTCGACKTHILAGEVTYRQRPSATHAQDEVILCCAVPAEGTDMLQLDL